ncbi:hypothetical protein OOT46_09240 [Aquabacterium sp. A7-Y]|uniref:hypothetical protein n=1 Tax=Aquabacterium sp. A7-Y TaxID=1349605 RepID=UPI00223CCEC0|nr:hypothetical protein [Aquabacterium sp. A7-Y]MCW7538030.1 hypothetical protein [Aquabacterium sp. A7-Y]
MGARDFIDDVADFLKALILGDFDDAQPVSAQLVGGAIGMIPVLDQVMDARDVAACLFKINRKGGFKYATKDDCIMLGFAALGSVPIVGSPFKGVFKPLWKERQAVGKALRGGVEMIERLLGMGKGGAIKWVRGLQWAALTQAAIEQAEAALASIISLLTWLSTDDRWWVPDSLEHVAADALPGIEAMRGQFSGPITMAIQSIKEFLEELLGEDAGTIAASVMLGVPSDSEGAKSAASKKRRGRGKGKDATPASADAPERHEPTGAQARGQTDTGHANTTSTTQRRTRMDWPDINDTMQGIAGEHISDYHCLQVKGWGSGWSSHDEGPRGYWSLADDPHHAEKAERERELEVAIASAKTNKRREALRKQLEDVRGRKDARKTQDYIEHRKDPLRDLYTPGKLNDNCKLVKLSVNGARGAGLDGLWRKKSTGTQKYAVIDAKCYLDPSKSLKSMLYDEVYDKHKLAAHKAATKQVAAGHSGSASGSKRGVNGAPANQGPTQTGTPPQKPEKDVVPMSHTWIEQRIERFPEDLRSDVERKYKTLRNYSRHVFHISSLHVADHFAALLPDEESDAPNDAASHTQHAITREYQDKDIEAVVRELNQKRTKRAPSQP